MSSNFVFVVLTPNGRRETVKVTPNTSILQVLEDVCQKQQLNSNEWDLKHYNRVIELGNSVRFSGLPNNATLEMIASQKPRVENLVKLGLQLESGKRLMNQFSPHQTLWEVLLHWDGVGEIIFPKYSEEEELIYTQPVCIYMRQEVVGKDQLQLKTLKSLGLTHGSAVIRLVHRSESQLRHQANVSRPISRQTISVEEPRSANEPAPAPHSRKEPTSLELAKPTCNAGTTSPAHVDNQMKSSSPIVPPLEVSNAASASAKAEESGNAFAQTPMEQDYGPESQGTASGHAPVENLIKLSVDGQLHILGERDALLYHLDDVSRHTSSVSIPDSFYDVTSADVNMMFRDLQEKRIQLENAPLQTASARALERDTTILKNIREHPITIVRVRFGDRFVLQGKFQTIDTIAAVENFVRGFLLKPDLPFYLFTTPPKTTLPSTSRLVEENLVGNAIVYFGSEESTERFLRPELYEMLSCPDAVQDHLHGSTDAGNQKPRLDSTAMNLSDDNQIPSTSQQGASEAAAAAPRPRATLNPGSSRANDGKVPKWFKTSK